MKKEKLYETIGDINENYVNEAHMTARKSRPGWLRWGAMAACLALVVMVATVAMTTMFNNADTPPVIGDTSPTASAENKYERGYFYQVDEGAFSTYVGGKVISEEKLGSKVEDISVTAGWKNAAGEWISTENLRCEIYLIDGVASDVAVALKFLDKGEAVTTTHYYVILNPNADVSIVKEYVIAPIVPNNPGNEMASEILE